MEEKPDVTYSDVGGCKEQIEKLREVVETPLLHVSDCDARVCVLTLVLPFSFPNDTNVIFTVAREIHQPWH